MYLLPAFLLLPILPLAQLAEENHHPLLDVLELWEHSPEVLAEMIRSSPIASIVDIPAMNTTNYKLEARVQKQGGKAADVLPFVFAHGMGDSCFNPGMKRITADAGKHAGVYSTCIPTGDNQPADTIHGFFMTMNKNVEVFAEKVRADPKLANGFNAFGFSQGNSVLRGYIQKYNDPPVNAVIHVHGTVSGVAGFPQCDPSKNVICKAIASACGDAAYNPVTQNMLFQVDYFRDPTRVQSQAFKKYSELADWNNEGLTTNATYNENFGKTNKFVMVKAMGDTMVFPNEGEWWGHFEDGARKKVLTMKETEWYTKDLFGLKTADESGKIAFESTPGNHLQFSEQDLFGWIDKYIVNSE